MTQGPSSTTAPGTTTPGMAPELATPRDDSLSGNERNHLFINRGGTSFDDVSTLSGLDCLEDTRASVLFDYDRDGWLDIAVVNCNAPAFRLFHNDMADGNNIADGGGSAADNKIIAVRLVGGATVERSQGYAPRDGYGGKVLIHAGDKMYLRESRAGEGFAAQNSRTLLVGIGANDYASDVEIRWPSGEAQHLENVAAGTLVTCFEHPADSPDGSGFVSEPYLRNAADELLRTGVATGGTRPTLELEGTKADQAELKIVTTMATWCEACRGELPQLTALRNKFSTDELAIYAVPIDANDDAAKLSRYRQEYDPSYRLLSELPEAQRRQVQDVVKGELGTEALPATLILNSTGEVIASMQGVPTISELQRLMSAR